MIEYALCNLAPGSLWVIHNNSYEGIEWLSTDITKPTKEQVNAEVARHVHLLYEVEIQR